MEETIAPRPASPMAKSGKRYAIATIGKIAGIAWFDRLREGVERFGRDTGNTIFIQAPAGRGDATEQERFIEDFIARKVDALCVVPFSPEALEPVLKRAMDAGIVVVVHESSGQRNAHLILEAFDNVSYGSQMLRVLARHMGGEGEFATFVGSVATRSHNEWMDGAERTAREEFPGLKLVSRRNEDYGEKDRAYERAKELLAAFPKLKGILGAPSTAAPGAARAVEECGLVGKVFVVGTATPSSVRRFIDSGACSAIAFWDPAMAAYAMNRIAVDLLEGGGVVDGQDLGIDGYNKLLRDKNNPRLFYGSEWVFADKSNIGGYAF